MVGEELFTITTVLPDTYKGVERAVIESTVKIGENFLSGTVYGELKVINGNHEKYEEIVYTTLPGGDYLSPPVFYRSRVMVRNSRSGKIICMKAD